MYDEDVIIEKKASPSILFVKGCNDQNLRESVYDFIRRIWIRPNKYHATSSHSAKKPNFNVKERKRDLKIKVAP